MSIVSIVKCGEYDKEKVRRKIEEALDLINFKVQPGENAVVKVNLWHFGHEPAKAAEIGMITHPIFVAALTEVLKCQGAKVTVVECDGTGFNADEAFEKSGMKSLVEHAGGEVRNLMYDEKIKVPVDGSEAKEINVPKTIHDAGVLISAPTMKAHEITTVTLGMKNMFGALPIKNKIRYHDLNLHQFIPDIVTVMTPDLTVIDGIVGYEQGGPEHLRQSHKTEVIIAGADVVATDAVASAIMGFNSEDVKHISNAALRGLGIADLSKIKVKGVRINDARDYYRQMRPSRHFQAGEKVLAKLAKFIEKE